MAHATTQRSLLLKELHIQAKHCPASLVRDALGAFGFRRDQGTRTHDTYREPGGTKVIVPASGDVKRFYVEQLVAVLQEILKRESEGNEFLGDADKGVTGSDQPD